MAAHPRAVLCLALLLAGSAGYRMKAPENQAECEKAIAAANMVSYGSGSYGSGRGCFSFLIILSDIGRRLATLLVRSVLTTCIR